MVEEVEAPRILRIWRMRGRGLGMGRVVGEEEESERDAPCTAWRGTRELRGEFDLQSG